MEEVIDIKSGKSSIGVPIECKLYKDKYTIEINGELEAYYDLYDNITINDIFNGALVIANSKYGVKQEVEYEPTTEDILAEVLLNQAEIMANQNAQDEVLAEVLLNSLEVSTNV